MDFIEAVAEVGPMVRLRLLQLELKQFVILIVRSFVYRELTRQVIIVNVTSRQCQVYPYACLTNAMRGYDEGILALSNVKSIPPTTENSLRKLYKYSMKNDKSTEEKHETNHINNKYNDMNMNTRKMHNT